MEYNGKKVVRMLGVGKGKDILVRLQLEDGFVATISSQAIREGGDRTYVVTEMCGQCGTESVMAWDTDKRGYMATCPHCGKPLLLCDECLHSEDNEAKRCDWSPGKGCFRFPKNA